MTIRYILIILLSFLLVACQLTSISTGFFDTPSGSVLYQDDFSDPSSGWENYSDDDIGTMDYFDGYYRIHVLGEYQYLMTGPGLIFSNVTVAVDSIKVIGTSNDMYGLVCRATNPDNFYFFVVSSDGYYGIGKVIAGVQSMIASDGMLPSEIISQGKSKNHLVAECIDNQLALYVNGQHLMSVNDTDLDKGDAGLLVGTMQDEESVVLFNNFSVINP